MLIKSSAPGKIILFGEHFVVYGAAAIACAIQKRSHCQISDAPDSSANLEVELRNYNETLELPEIFEPRGEFESFKGLVQFLYRFKSKFNVSFQGLHICLHSELPPAMGLGSSASILAALAYGLNLKFNLNLPLKELNNLTFQGEHVYHGTPSGIDNTLCTFGGMIQYQQGKIDTLDGLTDTQFLVINSGIPRNTRSIVEQVRKFKESKPNKFEGMLSEIREIVTKAKIALEKKDIQIIGQLMDANHKILRELGVSHPKIDQIVQICQQYGALGTKITGAGAGGCVICLIDDENIPALQQSLTDNGITFFPTTITKTGALGDVSPNGYSE